MAVAFAQHLGSIDIIDLTEDDAALETLKRPSAREVSLTFPIENDNTSNTLRLKSSQEDLISAASRAEAASKLFSSRLKSWTEKPRLKIHKIDNALGSITPGIANSKTSSKVFHKPTTLHTLCSTRDPVHLPSNLIPLSSTGSLGPKADPFSADAGQRASYAARESSESVMEENRSQCETRKREISKTILEDANLAKTRSPRKAARSANLAIANSYEVLNPLEEKFEAGLTTPKKPGRPRKDEWTPAKPSVHGRGGGKPEAGMRNVTRGSLSPMSRNITETRQIENDDPTEITVGSKEPLSKKRKLSSISGNSQPSTMHSGQQPSSSLPSDPAIANLVKDIVPGSNSIPIPVASAALSKWYDAIVHPAIHKATKRYSEVLTMNELTSIGKSIADDAVKQKLIPFISGDLSLPTDDQRKQIKCFVKKIFKQRVAEILSQLNTTLEDVAKDSSVQDRNLGRVSTDNISEVSKDVKREVYSSDRASTPTMLKRQGEKITNLSEYLKALEDEALYSECELLDEPANLSDGPRNLIDKNLNPPRVPCSDCRARHRRCVHGDLGTLQPLDPAISVPDTHVEPEIESSPNQAVAKDGTSSSDVLDSHSLRSEDAAESAVAPKTVPFTLPLHRVSHGQASFEPGFASDEPFPPGFDRGRFPAQRRRRANKFYTPERPPTTNLKILPPYLEAASDRLTRQATVQHTARGRTSRSRQSRRLPETTPPEDLIRRELAKRLNSDQALKDLCQAIASGKASDLQLKAFQQHIDDIGDSIQRAIPSASQVGNTVLEDIAHETESDSLSSFEFGSGPDQSHWPASQSEQNTLLRTWAKRYRHDAQTKERSTNHGSDAHIAAKFRIRAGERTMTPVKRSLATANNSSLEKLVAEIVASESRSPQLDYETRYRITEKDQRQLLQKRDLVKYVDEEDAKLIRLETRIIDPTDRPQRSISSLLRQRELGSHSRGIYDVNELRLRHAEKIKPWRYCKGASGDIVAAAWAPDSLLYAVGAAAHTNEEDLQYNRPCNLLVGELTSNTLTELPDHRVDRPKPGAISSGPNASQAVYDACDPNVYHTVTSIAFTPSGDQMYTASHDKTVKIWDVYRRSCIATLAHDSWVTSVEASQQWSGLFATAAGCIKDPIRIYHSQGSDYPSCYTQFSSSRALARPLLSIHPECLRWGPTAQTSHLLLAGFHTSNEEDGENGTEGQLILWDVAAGATIKVAPSSQSVFAAAWHPTQPFFATGGAPGNNVTNKWLNKSVVRTWDVRSSKHYTMEYECTAVDMQDITFSPNDSNIVTAGCTDGTSFVWDFRWPDQPLHRLRHGRPIVGWDHGEEVDTGVMMSLWGLGGTIFYTGSSDGMIKAWDVRRHPQDVLVKNVAQFGAGIQSGAFSPDGTNLLVGDAEGGVHVLSSAPCGPRTDMYDRQSNCREEPIALLRAPDGSGRKLNPKDDSVENEGREAANELVRTGQVEYYTDLGVGKGPRYEGPYGTYWRTEHTEPTRRGHLKPEIERSQPFSRRGERRDDIINSRKALLEERRGMILNKRNKRRGEEYVETSRIIGNVGEQLSLTSIPGSGSPRLPSKRLGQTLLDTPSESQRKVTDIARSTPAGILALDLDVAIENLDITESEMIEENYWWPQLGHDEIELARQGRRLVDRDL